MARTGRPMDENRTPLRLHGVLRRHGISQEDLCKACRYESGQRKGQPLSSSTMSTLLTVQRWPRTVRIETLQNQVAMFLRARGVSEDEIATAWKYEGSDLAPAPPPAHSLIGDINPHHQASPEDPAHAPFTLPENEMLSQEAREHFALASDPFINEIRGPKDVFLSANQRYVRESMYYAAKHAGMVAVIGQSGSGKSTLRRDLLERIRRDEDRIVVVQVKLPDKGKMTSNHLCDALIYDLSNERPRQSLEAKARQVERILAAGAQEGQSHVLIIEEAHDLTKHALKLLKRFWEFEDGYRRLLGIVLVAQPELDNMLDLRRNPDLRELIQRMEIARLKPLDLQLEDYLRHKFACHQVPLENVFEANAFDAIRTRLTGYDRDEKKVVSYCYPLAVQTLLSAAMNQVVQLGLEKVSGELVGRL